MKGKPGKAKDAPADSHIRVLKVGHVPVAQRALDADLPPGQRRRQQDPPAHPRQLGAWLLRPRLGGAAHAAASPGEGLRTAITSGSLNATFAGRSQHSSGFVLAALFHEGLLKPLADTRGYQPSGGVEFMEEVKRLQEKSSSPTLASVVAKRVGATSTQAQQTAAKPKADAAMPSEKKAKAPSKAKTAKR